MLKNLFKKTKIAIAMSTTLFLLFGCTHSNKDYFYSGRQNFLNQNYKLAIDQLSGPAEMGNPEAQYAVGYMYLNGLGTPVDNKRGYRWIKDAAQSGYPPAQDALSVLGPELEAEDEYGEYSLQTPPTSTPSKKYNPIKKRMKRYPPPPRPDQPPTVSPIEIPAKEEVITTSAQTGNHHAEALRSTPASSYTIQILGSYDLNSILSFVNQHQLQNQTHYYSTKRDGKIWYNLLYGTYPSGKEASKQINALPPYLKPLHPWAKPMKQVHREMAQN